MNACPRHEALRFALALTLGAITGAAADGSAPAPAGTDGAQPKVAPAATAATPADAAPHADAPKPKPRPRLSPEVAAQLVAGLPVWKPLPPGAQPPPTTPPPADPDVIQMKAVIVRGDKVPPHVDDKEWRTPKARDDVLMNQYLSDFDRTFLNRYTLPIVGVSKEARARMMYEEDKRLQDLSWMNSQVDQLKKVDPAEAKELAKIRDDTFTRDNSP